MYGCTRCRQRKHVPSPPKTPNRNLIVIESYLRFSSYAAMNEEGEASSHAELSSASHSESKRPLDLPSDSLKPLKISRSSTEGAEKEANDRGEVGSAGAMSQSPRVQRYLIAVEYIGTRFFGSQKQPNCRTVVGALEVCVLWSRVRVSYDSCGLVFSLLWKPILCQMQENLQWKTELSLL